MTLITVIWKLLCEVFEVKQKNWWKSTLFKRLQENKVCFMLQYDFNAKTLGSFSDLWLNFLYSGSTLCLTQFVLSKSRLTYLVNICLHVNNQKIIFLVHFDDDSEHSFKKSYSVIYKLCRIMILNGKFNLIGFRWDRYSCRWFLCAASNNSYLILAVVIWMLQILQLKIKPYPPILAIDSIVNIYWKHTIILFYILEYSYTSFTFWTNSKCFLITNLHYQPLK